MATATGKQRTRRGQEAVLRVQLTCPPPPVAEESNPWSLGKRRSTMHKHRPRNYSWQEAVLRVQLACHAPAEEEEGSSMWPQRLRTWGGVVLGGSTLLLRYWLRR